jgi:hypothetical protein
VTLSDSTQDLYLQGDVWTDLAIVLRAANDPEATAAAQTALARYESKGAALPAVRTRRWLSAPGEPTPVTGMPG